MSSKFYGVGWHKQAKKWRAFVRHNGKYVNLGCNFDTELAAAKAVDVWLRENGRAAEANFDERGIFVPRVSTKSSKYRGVSWYKKSNQWQAMIGVAGKNEHQPRLRRRRGGGGTGVRHARGRVRPPDELRPERRRDRLLGLSRLVAFFELRSDSCSGRNLQLDRDNCSRKQVGRITVACYGARPGSSGPPSHLVARAAG